MIDWVYLSLTYLTRPNFNILALVSLGECAYYDADTLVILGPNSAEETTFLVVDRWGFPNHPIRCPMSFDGFGYGSWFKMDPNMRVLHTVLRNDQLFDGNVAFWWEHDRLRPLLVASEGWIERCEDGNDRDCGTWRVPEHVWPSEAHDKSLTMLDRLTRFQQPIPGNTYPYSSC